MIKSVFGKHNIDLEVHHDLRQDLITRMITHNMDLISHADIRSELELIRNLAEGGELGKTFWDEEEMNDWLNVPLNLEGLAFGFLFLILDPNAPDYRWDGAKAIPAKTAQVNLENYYTKMQVDLQNAVHDAKIATDFQIGHIDDVDMDDLGYIRKNRKWEIFKAVENKPVIGDEEYVVSETTDREVNITLSEDVKSKLNKVDDVYTKDETENSIIEGIRGIFIGNENHDFYMITKSNIKNGDEIVIPKPHDPYYKSVVLGVQEFVEGETKTEIIRTYDNTTKSSFEYNPYVSWDDGLALITSKTIHMDPIRELEDGITLYKTTIDLSEYKDLAIV